MLKPIVILFMLALLKGCSVQPVIYQPLHQYNPKNLLLDDEFAEFSQYQIETEKNIFYIEPSVSRTARNLLVRHNDLKAQSQQLIDYLFDEKYINLQYDDAANYTAQEAIENKRANCITLTILAYALANKAQMFAKFQDVEVPEYWNRTGQYSLLTGHVNLVLNNPTVNFRNESINIFNQNAYTIDFDPLINSQKFPSRVVSKNWVVGMFYNNKGAQALMRGNKYLAYAYFREAAIVAPNYAPSWVNLAVLYRQNSLLNEAKKTYEHAINLDMENYAAISNLAILLRKTGDIVKADELSKRLHDIRFKNPFYHKALGDNALYREQYVTAKKHYLQAIELDDRKHDFYYCLAKAYIGLGEHKKAKKLLKKAIKLNDYPDIDDIYIAKSLLL